MSIGNDPGKHDPAAQNGPDDGPQSLSLMGGVMRSDGLPDAGEADLLDGPRPTPRLSQGTLLILGVIAAATGVIYLMRSTGRSEMASGVTPAMQTRIEEALIKLHSPDVAPTDPLAPKNIKGVLDVSSIVSTLAQDLTSHQVPIEYVQKNPFAFPVVKSTDLAQVPTRPDDITKRLEAEFKTLKLTSISMGRRPLALVNGQMIQPGDKLGSFLVAEIDSAKVTLTGGGRTYTLAMDEQIKTRGH